MSFILALLFSFSVFPAHADSKRFQHKVYFEKTDFELHVFKINGRLQGRTLMIIGGIQGDEPGGYISADMYADIRLKRGNIIVIPRANFLSILANKRQINEDMNRRFAQPKQKIEEDKVVSVLKNLMHESDFLVNLHEGSGFYNPKYIDKMNNPKRYGQSIIADTEVFYSERCKCKLKLKEMAERVIENVNREIKNPKYYFKFNNHQTASKRTIHAEQRKSATYYALYTVGIPAFGIETSKSIKDLELKVRMHSMIINAFIKEIGIEFESPAIDLMKPRLKYMLVGIDDDYKVITRSDILRIPRGSKLKIKHIETNYDRGVTADVLGLGGVHDYGKVFTMKKNTKIILRKDAEILAKIPVRVYDSPTETQSFYHPPQLINKSEFVWFIIKVGDIERVIHPDDKMDVFEGDTFKIVDAVFYPSVKRKNLIVNFVGHLGGTSYGIEDDLGLSFTINDNLLKRFAIEKDLYHVYVKHKGKKVGKLYVKIKRPKIKYFILKDGNGKKLCYLDGETLNLSDRNMSFLDIVSEVDTEQLDIQSPCRTLKFKKARGKSIRKMFSCNTKNKKSALEIRRGPLLMGTINVVLK